MQNQCHFYAPVNVHKQTGQWLTTIKIESYHIVIGAMAYQAWGITKATDLAEHNRTWSTMYKYVSNRTGHESTSVCGGEGGGRGDEKFLNAIIPIHEC